MHRLIGLSAGAAALGFAMSISSGAQALSSHDCSVKYQAAKTAGTLNGMNYSAFRKAECGSDAAAAPATTTTAATPQAAVPPPASNPLRPAPSAPTAAPAPAPAPAATAASTSGAVFPTAISSKYASESAGKGRMHTCVDQYNLNKASNGNGGLKWIEKGGGYYSECNKRLKG